MEFHEILERCGLPADTDSDEFALRIDALNEAVGLANNWRSVADYLGVALTATGPTVADRVGRGPRYRGDGGIQDSMHGLFDHVDALTKRVEALEDALRPRR